MWKKWFFERLGDPPRSRLHQEWCTTVVKRAGSKANIEAFYAHFGYSHYSSDWGRARYAHVYLARDALPPIVWRTFAYHVRHLETYRAIATLPGTQQIKRELEILRPRGRQKLGQVTTESQFQDILATATSGLPHDVADRLALGLHLMYYCGFEMTGMNRIRHEDIIAAGESRFLWTKGRLVIIPPHVRLPASGEGRMFSVAVCRMLRQYKHLSLTMAALRNMRG